MGRRFGRRPWAAAWVLAWSRAPSPEWRRGWTPALGALTFLCVFASQSSAQEVRRIDLGDGLAVVQRWRACEYGACEEGARCAVWEPAGFRFGLGEGSRLRSAHDFARIRTADRIVAVWDVGVLYTDDRGASWHRGRWDWRIFANAIAFDAGSRFGVAVGESGYVWSTEDGGESWTDRGSSAGVSYIDVAVVGRVAVFVDSWGRAWRSSDGGSRRDLLALSPPYSLTTEEDAIVVTTPRRTLRVRRDGNIERR